MGDISFMEALSTHTLINLSSLDNVAVQQFCIVQGDSVSLNIPFFRNLTDANTQD